MWNSRQRHERWRDCELEWYVTVCMVMLMKDCCGGIARFTRVLFELRCYLQFEQEIHIVEVSYFTNILIK